MRNPYFCLCKRLGKHAYIGLGFDQRSDAFDFGVALEDHKKRVERGKDPSLHSIPLTKMSDEYALKDGEMISVDISGVCGRQPVVSCSW